VASANPLTPENATPDIDVFSNFSISATNERLNISGKLNGDNFPSTEAFISDPSGQNVFLDIGQISKGVSRNNGPFTELPNANSSRQIANFNLSISIDKKGNFTGVTSENQKYSIKAWNERFLNASPTQK